MVRLSEVGREPYQLKIAYLVDTHIGPLSPPSPAFPQKLSSVLDGRGEQLRCII